MSAAGYENGFGVTLHPERLAQPLQRRAATTYFANSMSDLFHEDVPDEFIDSVVAVMAATRRHTYQILTKRAIRMAQYAIGLRSAEGQTRLDAARRAIGCPISTDGSPVWPLPNVWLGVSVEDRKYGVPRISHLRRTPAAVRFLSIEPLLGDVGTLNLSRIDWVIVGGESGANARRMLPVWAENVQRQAVAQGVRFFFKQWGAWGADGVRRAKKRNGRELGGRRWDEFPVACPDDTQGELVGG